MKSIQTVFLVLALSLVSWGVFYKISQPLDRPETMVVTGFWLIVVLSGRWLWTRVSSIRAKEKQHDHD